MFRLALLAATFVSSIASAQATTLYTNLSSFTTAVGASGISATTSLGNNFDPISSVTLVNGTSIGLSGVADVVDQPGFGVGPFTNGYTGQVVDSTTNSETLTFSAPLNAFGLTFAPDVPLFATTAVTLTATLGSGASVTLSNNYRAGDTVFLGFAGGSERTLTLTTSAPDFSFGQFLTVPEPTTALLLGTVLIPLLRRRRSV